MKTRRRFLQGSGVSLSLPWLESLATGSGGRMAPPLRAAFLHFPNGAWMDDWTPAQTGTSYTLSPILQPLAPVQSELLVLTGLDKANSRPGEAHLASTANFLTGMSVRATTGRDIGVGGVSLDQHLAKSFVGKTLVPSLVLGCEPVRTGVDRIVNWTLLYSSLISWETPQRPVMPETNPRSAFESLFNLDSDGAQRTAGNRRLLDLVLEDAQGLRPRLGRDDRTRLDQYLDSVQTVENRLRFIESADRHLLEREGALEELPAVQAAAEHEMALQQGAGGTEQVQSFLSRHGGQGAEFAGGRTSPFPGCPTGAGR